MYELFVERRTLPDSYHEALVALHTTHNELTCSDYNTRQKESSLTFHVQSPLVEPMISRLFIGGPDDLEQYCQEVVDGIMDFEVERGNWDYTYHQRMENQIGWVIDELKRNPDSRRACMSIRSWKDQYLDSPACLQHIQYFIRNGLLHCKVLFRSNDLCKATFQNAFALIMLQKKVADEIKCAVGSYTHKANSMHVYKRDYNLFDAYVQRIKSGSELTYNYKGEWDELMEEAKSGIALKVKELRER